MTESALLPDPPARVNIGPGVYLQVGSYTLRVRIYGARTVYVQ